MLENYLQIYFAGYVVALLAIRAALAANAGGRIKPRFLVFVGYVVTEYKN
jgi:hypothetical protein